MQALTLQENLHKALSYVSKSISIKTQLPILSNVLIETEEGRLKLASTNLETSICYWIGATVQEKGAITVPARILAELVASFTHDKIELTVARSQLKLQCGGSEASLSGIDAAEFPPLPEITDSKKAALPKILLEKGLPFVLMAASNDEGRPLLTGVRFSKRSNGIAMVATDGYRLSLKQLGEPQGLEDGVVIPSRALSEVYRLMIDEKASEVEMSMSREKNQVVFMLPNAQIITRLIEGEYPNYEKIIPSGFTTRAVVKKEDFQRAVKLASVYARESANIVRLRIGDSTLAVSANSPQIGENKTTLEVASEGDAGEIAFNARFLLDLLTVFPDDEVVFEMSGPLTPGVFKSPQDETIMHIIMPVRIQG